MADPATLETLPASRRVENTETAMMQEARQLAEVAIRTGREGGDDNSRCTGGVSRAADPAALETPPVSQRI